MDDLINMVAGNESPSEIHSKIKDLLTKKASDNVDVVTPAVTASMFGGPNPYTDETPTEDEASTEAEAEADTEQPTAEVETDSSEEEEIESPTAEVETPDDEEEN
ncbi:MAG: hypothetical protein CMG17_07135 [Candidatus Marinimicrobia bacterium]|jgi:hypothetical protein|nr:hypothetical protein [Candidatus Neomarinimicrobiota bacterium]|tara:strand:+ start:267 stop:581 length:315 start_codon:yes stop_codon:yes gene_type:complete